MNRLPNETALDLQRDLPEAAKCNICAQSSRRVWLPPQAPARLYRDQVAFHVFVLLPGVSHAFLQNVFGRSPNTIRRYKKFAQEVASKDTAVPSGVRDLMSALCPIDGLAMARRRGSTHLPFWSRLAIAEYRKAGHSKSDLASAFQCSLRTIDNVLHRTDFLTPERALAPQQMNPPGKFPRSLQE